MLEFPNSEFIEAKSNIYIPMILPFTDIVSPSLQTIFEIPSFATIWFKPPPDGTIIPFIYIFPLSQRTHAPGY
jgi:hypothetical protein